jgi:hypothetical protein
MKDDFVRFRVRLSGLAIALLAWTSCQEREPAGATPPAASGPERGETVLVEKSAAQFVAGRVIAREGDTLRVQGAGDGPSMAARVAEIYRLPGGEHEMHPGDLGICGLAQERWVGCRVESVTAKELVVTGADGESHRLARVNVLVPNELTALNLQRHFARASARIRFLREAKQAGVARAPADWRPRPHERLLAARAGRWYSARLRELGRERVYVIWQADERVTELPRAELLPEPPYAFTPHRGSYVLVRPSSPADPWETVRVEAVPSSERLMVVNVNEERREVALGDVVPLG